ncbi:MAG TPA: hypothetical protein GX513_08255 [Firmicutes bacterium]|nr:hypothetical protein [Bacillota bacterium]
MIDVLVFNDAVRDCVFGRWRPGGIWYSLHVLSGMGAAHGFVSRGSADDLSSLRQLPGHACGLALLRPGTAEYVVFNPDELLEQWTVRRHDYGDLTTAELEQTASFLSSCDTRAALVYPEYVNLLPYTRNSGVVAVDLQYLPPERWDGALEWATVVFGSEGVFRSSPGLVEKLMDWVRNKPGGVFVRRFGPGGSRIFTGGKVFDIAAFDIALRDSVGAGDVYNAAFLAATIRGLSLRECGEVATAAAALHCDQCTDQVTDAGIQLIRAHASRTFCPPEVRAGCRVYLAGPFFHEGQVLVIDGIRALLRQHGFEVFSPMHDAGVSGLVSEDGLFARDVQALDVCDVVVAVLDGEDPGTMWECGYACARGKPVIGYYTGTQFSCLNLMTRFGVEPGLTSNLKQLLSAVMKICAAKRG